MFSWLQSLPMLRSFAAFRPSHAPRYCVEPPDSSFSDDEAITAMTDWEWWLPRIKRAAARRFDTVARELGFVNVTAGLYCCNETYDRHSSQKKRNRKMMEGTILANECGDEYSLGNYTTHRTRTRVSGRAGPSGSRLKRPDFRPDLVNIW